MNELLIKLNACGDASVWAEGKTWKEIYETCHRGDWLLWLFKRTNRGDLKALTLAKAYCANTVRHLMKDERSIKAVDVAISFGEGNATRDELNAAAITAYDAAYAAADASAAYAAYAASAASSYAYAAAYSSAANAAYAASADYAYAAANAAADYDAARKANQQLTADICRKYLPIEIWNISSEGTLINQ